MQKDLLFSFYAYYRGTTLGLKFKFLPRTQRMLLPEKTELTHEPISTFPQETAAFVILGTRWKKGSLIFKTGSYCLSGSHSSKCLTLDIQNECTSESLVLFFKNQDAQIIPTWLALKRTFCWVQRSSDQVAKEVKHFTSNVTGGEYLRLHVKQKVYWAWMLQMKESFHSRVVWVQIKRVGSFSEHNHLFSSLLYLVRSDSVLKVCWNCLQASIF